MEAMCKQIHNTLTREFKYAMVWGISAKHSPQRVGQTHQLSDEDVVQVGWQQQQQLLRQRDSMLHTLEPSRQTGLAVIATGTWRLCMFGGCIRQPAWASTMLFTVHRVCCKGCCMTRQLAGACISYQPVPRHVAS